MSYQVFARKYRPKTFHDVLGQDHVVKTLRNAIERDRLAHAYLFVGPRGTGKTSTARIFAKALNCPGGPKADFDPSDPVCEEIAEGINLDVLEIDGASNNGVEQVRELRETVKFAPSSSKYKIYYIDEVHMLSAAAFNALLKTLEEPPAHVKFIFATTEPNKILPTIISRCQRFDLRRIPTPIIAQQLLHIAKEENVKLDEAAAYAVAKGADGGMRDAQSMLDQLVAFCGDEIVEENVLEIFGFTSMEMIAELTGSLLNRQTVATLDQVQAQSDRGKDLLRLMAELISYLRNLLVAQVDPKNEFEDLSPEVVETLRGQIRLTTPDRLLNLIDHFAETEARMKWATNKELQFEIGIIKGMQILSETNLSDVIGVLKGVGESVGGLPGDSGPAARGEGSSSTGKKTSKSASPASAGDGENAPAKKKAARKEAPAVEAEPEPKPERPKPAGDLRGAALWAAVLGEIEANKPLMSGWARSGVFLEEKPKQLVIGFSPDDAFFRDSLMRDKSRSYVEELIKEFGGKSLGLLCELSEDVEAGADFEEDDEEETLAEEEPVRAAAAQPEDGNAPVPEKAQEAQPEKASAEAVREEPPDAAKPENSSNGQGEEQEEEVTPAEPLDESEFRDDELIQEALRLFEGEIE